MKSDTPLILSLLCFALGQGERAVSFLSFARVEGGGPRPLSLSRSLAQAALTLTQDASQASFVGKSSQKESNAGSRTHCKLHAVPLLSFAESAEVLDPDRPPCQQILKHGPAEAGIRSNGPRIGRNCLAPPRLQRMRSGPTDECLKASLAVKAHRWRELSQAYVGEHARGCQCC